jgi:hypothetical protein
MFRLLVPVESENGNGEIPDGEVIEIVEYIGDWAEVRSAEGGRTGYVRMRDLEEIE